MVCVACAIPGMFFYSLVYFMLYTMDTICKNLEVYINKRNVNDIDKSYGS